MNTTLARLIHATETCSFSHHMRKRGHSLVLNMFDKIVLCCMQIASDNLDLQWHRGMSANALIMTTTCQNMEMSMGMVDVVAGKPE